eukprot:TRINITY_DN7431_c0_g1_i1.p1 TRINITY_DN7431_c0_g1~~TRINITY_DN7431_c0_g1_i1.p1  ORF type:complete len:595 (-),score=135.40 TRINITY_DN7431_c0_g1_i1:226-2010(-)
MHRVVSLGRNECLSRAVARTRTAAIRSYSNGTDFKPPVLVEKNGVDLMNDGIYNKGLAFTTAERDRFGVRGLMPPVINSLEEQASRLCARLNEDKDEIRKWNLLSSLQDRNETLFYKVLIDNIKQLAPVVYTPTVGRVAQRFGFLYRRPRGMYFSSLDRGEIGAMVYNWPEKEVDIVVITDGSRILGLGDLGVNGMAIPIGKSALYVAAGGIHPARVLPILLDVGTNNETFLQDPFYLGLKQKRITGPAYYSLLDEVMHALRNRWPNVLVQFEDFSNQNAYPILEKYRRDFLCFNDDIQGTGAVALAGIYSALRAQGKAPSDIISQRIVCLGAGSAGLGVINNLYRGMIEHGLSAEEARKNFWLVDHMGFLSESRKDLSDAQRFFARKDFQPSIPLHELVRRVQPTIMLGLSGVAGVFTEAAVREMARFNSKPILFPLSNPTEKAECSARQAFEWTEGRALFASGSPFEPVEINGKVCLPSQGNNMFIYPGIGLAAVSTGLRTIPSSMFSKAAETLANCVSDEELEKGLVYPDISNIRSVSLKVAVEVARLAYAKGLATKFPPESVDLETFIQRHMYQPQYSSYVLNEVASRHR